MRDPNNRLSAEDALRHHWFEVGYPRWRKLLLFLHDSLTLVLTYILLHLSCIMREALMNLFKFSHCILSLYHDINRVALVALKYLSIKHNIPNVDNHLP